MNFKSFITNHYNPRNPTHCTFKWSPRGDSVHQGCYICNVKGSLMVPNPLKNDFGSPAHIDCMVGSHRVHPTPIKKLFQKTSSDELTVKQQNTAKSRTQQMYREEGNQTFSGLETQMFFFGVDQNRDKRPVNTHQEARDCSGQCFNSKTICKSKND